MPVFPRSEMETVGLAEQMIAGYTDYPADFPSVTVATLSTALADYQTARQAQLTAAGQAKIATETKDAKMAALVEVMKNDLKVSEVDTAANPGKLAEIGWGTKAQPQPMTPPNQPNELWPVVEGPGNVTLSWKKPSNGANNHVRNYFVQRRTKTAATGDFSDWAMISSAYDTTVELTGQPRGVQMEYAVTAANPAGESTPSNSVAVVL